MPTPDAPEGRTPYRVSFRDVTTGEVLVKTLARPSPDDACADYAAFLQAELGLSADGFGDRYRLTGVVPEAAPRRRKEQ